MKTRKQWQEEFDGSVVETLRSHPELTWDKIAARYEMSRDVIQRIVRQHPELRRPWGRKPKQVVTNA